MPAVEFANAEVPREETLERGHHDHPRQVDANMAATGSALRSIAAIALATTSATGESAMRQICLTTPV
jgi:hypothetical protein